MVKDGKEVYVQMVEDRKEVYIPWLRNIKRDMFNGEG